MSFFSEKEQKAYVLEGKYKVYIGRNSADESLADEFSVSGELESKLKNRICSAQRYSGARINKRTRRRT